MPRSASCSMRVILSSLVLLCSLCAAQAIAHEPRAIGRDQVRSEEGDFHTFVTRPDIRAPRWKVRVYNEEAVAPGYWFIAPYGKANDESVGPHIYDSSGDPVWSGAPIYKGSRIFDFRVAKVGGRDMITLIDPKAKTGVLIDDGYMFYKRIDMGESTTFNVHDFNIEEEGRKALFVKRDPGKASRDEAKAVGYEEGECKVIYDGFEEWDLHNPGSKPLFSWSSEGHVELGESMLSGASSCRSGFDYFHANSIDKFPDGDYLLNGRFTGALYKISAQDGSIVWRLGGKNSSFQLANDVRFSAQGHARVQTQDDYHTTISLIDNAYLDADRTTSNHSRGLLLLLRTTGKPMVAEIVAKYGHPRGGYAKNQGDFQILPKGNAFLGWRDNALQSEHTDDGKVIMEASLLSDLYSYRNFKFPWVGRPRQPPDVYAEAVDAGHGMINMTVHVSWNGATEVKAWNLLRTDENGVEGIEPLVQNVQRSGFETTIHYHGYANYIIVEALDANNRKIITSEVFKTIATQNFEEGPTPYVVNDLTAAGWWFTSWIATIFYGCMFGCIGIVGFIALRRVWQKYRPSSGPWWKPMSGVYRRLSKEGDELELEDVEESDDEDQRKENG